MECEEARVLIAPALIGYFGLASKQYAQFKAHLASCLPCAYEYQQARDTIAFINVHKAEFACALSQFESSTDHRSGLEYGWTCIEAKLDQIQAPRRQEKRTRLRRRLRRVSAAAACITVAVAVYPTLTRVD